MNDLASLFCFEMARSSASASASDFASGKLSCRSNRMFFGTVASISASRLSKPRSHSISRASFSLGPIWRRAKESIGSVRVCMVGQTTRRGAVFNVGAALVPRSQSVRRDTKGPSHIHSVRVVDLDGARFEMIAHFGDMVGVTRFDGAEDVHRGKVSAAEGALVHDLFDARAGGGDFFSEIG